MDAFWAALIMGNVWLASGDARGAVWGPMYLLLAICTVIAEVALRNV